MQLRALLLLGQQHGRILTIQEISKKTLVTMNYFRTTSSSIKKLGYVESKRGAKGGYQLLKEPDEINIGEVIRKLEGPLSPMTCASITQYKPCPIEEGCLLKPLWSLIRDATFYILDKHNPWRFAKSSNIHY